MWYASANSSLVPDVGLVLRLVGGPSRGGRLEVLHDDTWGTVCDDGFNSNTTRVLCATLGFGFVSSSYKH